MKEDLPTELILRARAAADAGQFQREIVDKVPKSIEYDTLTLSCGHTLQQNRRWSELITKKRTECQECLSLWLAKEHAK